MKATFTGMDVSMTPCSGGYFFTIGDSSYRAFEIAANKILNEQSDFPKKYEVKIRYKAGGCYSTELSGKLVQITAIKQGK
ncbi:hypothetical protein GC194_10655 [bacterium]|nr:hypothetical protein [bacterium]